MTEAVLTARPHASVRHDLTRAARALSVLTLVGAACGVFVVGVLARLAMMLLAALNPSAAGVTSDDGFVIGQFTLSGAAQLALAGVQFGVLGAAGYVAARGLLIGPPWFRLLSISLGPAVVIGAIIVNTDGVDFQLLEPTWLAVGLFIAIPAVFVALLHLIGERALDRWRPGRVPLALGLLPWVALLPVTLMFVAVFRLLQWLRGRERGRAILDSAWTPWIPRCVLAALFVLALLDLRSDLTVLA